MRVAWLLNLDAEEELAGRVASAARVARFAAGLRLPPGDAGFVLDAKGTLAGAGEAEPRWRCWCPTPRALGALAGIGAEAPAAPPRAVLERVLSRRFALEAGPTLPGQRFHRGSYAEVEAAARAAPERGWRLKRGLGFAGRGHRVVGASGTWTAADRRWIGAALAEGGLLREPELLLTAEASTHGHVDVSGAVRVLAPLAQRVARGAWRASLPLAGSALEAYREALEAEAAAVGARLAAAGFHGPFGVDAYLFAPREGAEPVLNPRGEVNARWTMCSVARAPALLS